MMRRTNVSWLVALLASALIVAATNGIADARTTGKVKIPTGGTLVLGASQEADCADWIHLCAGSSWGQWTMQEQTIPRPFNYAMKKGNWTEVPSALMAGMPTVKTVDGRQVVTYKINPKAVWSDGVPITSDDFAYTLDQIVNGEDIYDATGYMNVDKIDTTDPMTAVMTFKAGEPFASWRTLFGPSAAILPSHILKGKDRAAEMADGYAWSGGPWFMSWEKGVGVTLTPNPKYWGTKPKLDKVIFKFITDTSASFQAFESGEVLAIYPTPQLDAVEKIKDGIPGSRATITAMTGNTEALWINNDKPPFERRAMRQAIAYSIDRDALVGRLFADIGVDKAVQTLNPPILSRYSDTKAFAGYTRNLKKVASLMKSEGWAKNSKGFWEKNGKEMSFTINSTAGDKRRELTEEILQEQLRSAGFRVSIDNMDAGDLFGEVLPTGDYQVALYAQVATSLDPGLCTIACSENIPGPMNDDSGQNYQRINVKKLDPLLETVDVDTNVKERIRASKAADVVMAEHMVSLPLDPLPNIFLWSKKIVGSVRDNPVLSPFWNMNKWGLKR
ncbi:MAG: peptide ABC transporter substrate-binding protein [Acidimicrobiia bacterium]|nr:peptide ABC transporter substrate-binding protein [Acidimicrobiia bacterium]